MYYELCQAIIHERVKMGYKAKTQKRANARINKNHKRYKGARKNGPPSPFGIAEEMLIEQYQQKLSFIALLDLLILTFHKPFTKKQLSNYLNTRGFEKSPIKRTRLEEVELPTINREAILAQIPEVTKKAYDAIYAGEENVKNTECVT